MYLILIGSIRYLEYWLSHHFDIVGQNTNIVMVNNRPKNCIRLPSFRIKHIFSCIVSEVLQYINQFKSHDRWLPFPKRGVKNDSQCLSMACQWFITFKRKGMFWFKELYHKIYEISVIPNIWKERNVFIVLSSNRNKILNLVSYLVCLALFYSIVCLWISCHYSTCLTC